VCASSVRSRLLSSRGTIRGRDADADQALAGGRDHGDEGLIVGDGADVQAAKGGRSVPWSARRIVEVSTYEIACEALEQAQETSAEAPPVVQRPVLAVRAAKQLE
jgi:hypothetical protein